MLPLEIFKTVIASTPLISIDLIVHNSKLEVLLGKRLNKPAQGCWFVPGGRILKDESLKDAFKRLVETELGISVHNGVFKGIYQHFYSDNVTGPNFSTHYVVLAYEITLSKNLCAPPKEQHSEYKWLSQVALLKDDNVHRHTKWYFQKGQAADASFVNKNI